MCIFLVPLGRFVNPIPVCVVLMGSNNNNKELSASSGSVTWPIHYFDIDYL